MNVKTKKLFVIYTIFSLLQCCTFASKCKINLAYEEDMGGTLEEVKTSVADSVCTSPEAACYSILAEEITLDGDLSEHTCFILR